MRALREHGGAHSVVDGWRGGDKKWKTPKGMPFPAHLAEGVDEDSAKRIFDLHRAGALDEKQIVIHGLALGKEGHARLRDAGAGLVWCPSSTYFFLGGRCQRTKFARRESSDWERFAADGARGFVG